MPVEQLPHNRNNAVTRGVWWEDGAVHKVLTGRRADAPAHWVASDDPRHWNYWRREALVYETGLPARLGLGAPALLEHRESDGGDIELVLEDVRGRHGAAMSVDDLAAIALALGRSQGRAALPKEPWLSRGFLADYSTSRPADFALLEDERAWAHPLIAKHFPPDLREGLRRLHHNRGRLLSVMLRLPRTVCHLDVWPNNALLRSDGEVVLLDWAFAGDGAIGEDVGNLVPDSFFDWPLRQEFVDHLDATVSAAYLEGLAAAGWRGDERLVLLGIRAAAVKYDWLTPWCLKAAAQNEHRAYGSGEGVDPDVRYAARAAGLALCARWADDAMRLVDELGF